MNKTLARTVEAQVNGLIDQWGKDMSDEDFVEALGDMEDRACTAREAREDEIAEKELEADADGE